MSESGTFTISTPEVWSPTGVLRWHMAGTQAALEQEWIEQRTGSGNGASCRQ